MLLRQIEYYCAVCRAGSFTRAAEEHFVSQSAISQQVKALEAELGVTLLERRGRTFAPTPAGEHFYRKASAILREFESLRMETLDIAGGLAPKLTVGYLNRYEGWEVQGAVAAFSARHPHVEIDVISGSHDDLYRALLSGKADIAFNDQRRALSDEFVNVFLVRAYAYVELSDADELAQRDALRVSDLKGRTCILISSPDQEDAEQAYYADTLNFDCEFRFARSRDEGRMLVAANHGFMPIEMHTEERASGGIVRRVPLAGVDDDQIWRDYYAFWLKARTNRSIEMFADVLRGVFA